MADELTYSVTMAYAKGNLADSLSVLLATKSPSGVGYTKLSQSIATSETPIELGGISSLGGVMLVNTDATNYVDIKVAASGAICARLRPDTNSDGKGGVFFASEMGSGAQVPVAIANTSACVIDVFIVNA